MHHGRKRSASDLDALAAEAVHQRGQLRVQRNDDNAEVSVKVSVPLSFVEAARTRTGEARFLSQGFRGSPATWSLLTNILEGRGEEGAFGVNEERVRRLEQELVAERSESVRAVLSRAGEDGFPIHFGLSKKEFDYIMEIVTPDLEGMSRVFAQRPPGMKLRDRSLAIELEDVLGIVCRHILLHHPFALICRGFPRKDKHAEKGRTKSENWARKIFDAARDVLATHNSAFSKAFMRRQTPTEVWEYTKERHYEVVEFLREYVEDYDEKKTYYVVLVDGTHFVAKTVNDFYAVGLTYSRKKGQNTLLSVCGSVATGMFAFFTEPVGGKTSEKAACDGTDMYAKVVSFASSHNAEAVFVVDKGFGFFVKYAEAAGGRQQHVFIPYGARGGKQLTTKRAEFNRAQARIRMPVEHCFGCLKRRCQCLKWGAIQLGSHGTGSATAQAERLSKIVYVGIGFFNSFRLVADPLIKFKRRTQYEVSCQ